MGWFSSDRRKARVSNNWNQLSDIRQLEELKKESNSRPIVIFKHSTRCSVSFMALQRLESDWPLNNSDASAWFLDLLAFRNVSNQIEQEFGVIHQSPQVLVIRNEACVYEASHSQITPRELKRAL